MDMSQSYWEENSNSMQRVKYESCSTNDELSRMKDERGIYPCCDTNLNFATATCSEDDCEYGPYKKNKVARQDPMSHRIIEKRRRDRMNNCLADLSRLIPTEYLKKGRGRIEKTEIIEMAIKHMKYLQQEQVNPIEHFRLGYQECMSETMRFMVEVEGHFPREAVCIRLLNHLQKHCESISRTPHIPPSNPPTLIEPNHMVPDHTEPLKNFQNIRNSNNTVNTREYTRPKTEQEPNNNTNGFIVDDTQKNGNVEHDFEKHNETNGMSYKYKTNIKLRFNQDIVANETPFKRAKIDDGRRNSLTSNENHSSSHSSPPSSEPCRISDSENTNRRTPSDTASVNNNNLKLEHSQRVDVIQRMPPTIANDKHNFNVPIFVLHAKGSYYIPLTIDYKTLLPFLQNYDILEVVPTMHNIVLHPVTINVNFLPNFNSNVNGNKYKSEFNNNWH